MGWPFSFWAQAGSTVNRSTGAAAIQFAWAHLRPARPSAMTLTTCWADETVAACKTGLSSAWSGEASPEVPLLRLSDQPSLHEAIKVLLKHILLP
jgi:hypothetical protein